MSDDGMKKGSLAWIDIETTGLDPQHNDILETALVVTDFDLNEHKEIRDIIDNLS